MNLPVGLLLVASVLFLMAATGMLAVLIPRLWEWVANLVVSPWITALFAALVRALLAAVIASARALLSGANLSPADQQHLEWAFWLAVIGGVLWETATAVGKARKEKAASRARFLAAALGYLEASDNVRRQSVEQAARARAGATATIHHARNGLAPRQHLIWLLDNLAGFYAAVARETNLAPAGSNFRVALFSDLGGTLVPRYSFSLRHMLTPCLQSPTLHPHRYSLTNTTDPACAVQCIQAQRLVIVEDGRKRKYPNFYLDGPQRDRLRSLAAYPIMRVGAGGVHYPAALVIDTEMPGFFRERARVLIDAFLQQVVARLNLEDGLEDLLY